MYVIGPRNHFATLPTYVAPPCAIVQTAVFPEAPLKGPLHIILFVGIAAKPILSWPAHNLAFYYKLFPALPSPLRFEQLGAQRKVQRGTTKALEWMGVAELPRRK